MKILFLTAFFFFVTVESFSQEIFRTFTDSDPVTAATFPVTPDFARDTFHIREVEIVADRKLTEAALRITRPDSLSLHSGLTVDLAELLSRNTPVFIKSYGRGSQATAHFRGTSASHSGIIWNGMLLNSPMRGYADLSQLPLFFIDNIWLLHGGSSLSSSSGALGGTVHLENLPDWDVKKVLKLTMERGSFQTGRYMARFLLGNSNLQSVTRVYAEHSENDFPFYNSGVIPHRKDTLRNGDYRKKAVLQEFYYRSENNLTFQARGWIQQNFRNLPPLMSYEGHPRIEYQKDDQYRLNVGFKKFNDRISYQYTGGLNYASMNYFHQSVAENYVIRDALSHEESWFSQFRFQYRLSKLFLTASAETSLIKVESDEKVKGEGYEKRRRESGLMVHFQYQPSDRTGLYFLSRSEVYDREVIPLIPSAGGEWKVIKDVPLYLKMNVTRNYHKPGLNDLWWNPGGNPELLPEEGLTGEVILASPWKGKSFSFSQELSWYFSGIRNWIMWQPAANGAWYWEAANIDKVRSYGLEYNFSSSLEMGIWEIRTAGNYAFTRTYRYHNPEIADYSRRSQLIYIPVHSANLHLTVSRRTWSILGDLSCTGERYTQMSGPTDHPGSSLPPFWLLNTSLQKKFEGKSLDWGIKWKVENLLNARYQQILWRPMPERNYSITISLGFKK